MRTMIIAAALALAASAAFAQPDGATPSAAPGAATEAPKKESAAQAGPSSGCAGTGDLAQLLSPECLDSLRALRAPVGPAATPPAPPALGGFPQTAPSAAPSAAMPVQCTVSIFGGTVRARDGLVPQAGAMSSFPVASLERCIEIAARMSYGIPGVTNIAAVDPAQGVVAVSCQREAPGGQRVTCQPQPSAQGKR